MLLSSPLPCLHRSVPTDVRPCPIVPQASVLRRCREEVKPQRHTLRLQVCKQRQHRHQAAGTETAETSKAPAGAGKEEYIEVELKKPLGLKFGRGNDGECYILSSDNKLGSTDDRIQPGDKIVQCSASFGPDIWDARNFGQVVYAIKTRNGDVYLKLLKRGGDMSIFKEAPMTEEERAFKDERGGGNYGAGTRALQERNYASRQKRERIRKEMFEEALEKFRTGNPEQALFTFEEVLAMEPKSISGKDMSRVSQIYRVSQYNIACCYSALNQVEAGLEALENSLKAGFEGFNKIREDPNLENIRKSKKFQPLIDRYDEPVINVNAFDVLRNLFRRE